MRVFVCFAWAMFFVAAATPATCETFLKVNYDAGQDELSVRAEQASLKKLLGLISLRSGIEIGMDPAAEKKVNLVIENQPIKDGLKGIARQVNLSYAMHYGSGKGADGEPLLTGMIVVPTGKPDAMANAKAVVALEQEAAHRARTETARSDDRHGKYMRSAGGDSNYADLRWQERLDSLPEERQQEVVELITTLKEKREKRIEEIRAKREQRRVQREKIRAEKDKERGLDGMER